MLSLCCISAVKYILEERICCIGVASMQPNLENKVWRVGTVIPAYWVELVHKRIRMMGFTSIGEYIRSLIRDDLEKAGLLGGEAEN